MIIKTLVDNTSISDLFGSEHGLSLYIETNQHKILFDTGASPLFAENAAKMNIDLSDVDLAIISHGHYDHGGGLRTFLEINQKANIYLNEMAFEKHYANKSNGEKKYIGLDGSMLPNERFIFVGKNMVIDEELALFSQVKGDKCKPSGNQDLFMEEGQSMVLDDFSHEQNLVIKENGKTVLVAGCAHTGMINILEQFRLNNACFPSYVIGGFHLYNRSADTNEEPEVVQEIALYLMNTSAQFYTCHCTGMQSYQILKSIMGEQVDYLATGSQAIL